jgi:Arc/MetJ family transcription regulator
MKTVIDLDTKLANEAARVLGTRTKKATIHAALKAAVEEAEMRAELRRRLINSAGGADIGNEEIMSKSW